MNIKDPLLSGRNPQKIIWYINPGKLINLELLEWLNFPAKSRYTNSYLESGNFTFWIKLCSTTIIISHPSKYLPTLKSLKSYNIFQLFGDLSQTLFDPRFINKNKISKTIFNMFTLSLFSKYKETFKILCHTDLYFMETWQALNIAPYSWSWH